MNNITPNTKTVRVRPDGAAYSLAAGQTTVTSEVIDTQGFGSVRVIALAGAVAANAVLSFKLTECDTSDGVFTDVPTRTDAPNPAVVPPVVGSSNKNAIIEGYRTKRYVKVATARGTANSEVAGMIAELGDARISPVPADVTVAAQSVLS